LPRLPFLAMRDELNKSLFVRVAVRRMGNGLRIA
jgi:hypothetical protein